MWHQLRQRNDASVKGLFGAWHLFSSFRRISSLQRQRAKEWRLRRLETLRGEAAQALECHDTYKAYQLINQLAPKTVRRRVQIRDPHGQPLGPVETQAAFVRLVHPLLRACHSLKSH